MASIINMLKLIDDVASLTDDARVIIYDRHMFIVQATGVNVIKMSSSLTLQQNTLED